jgi:glycine/D-amino acid oxidase-like deaminating enzyme
MEQADVIVVGGGIAGLAAAWHLSRAGASDVCLLEREPLLASHASGRNAAIFRHLDRDAEGVALALRSRELLASLGEQEGCRLLRRTGALFLGTQGCLRPMAELARRFGLATETVEGAAIGSLVSALAGGDAARGLLVPEDGVLDVHALVEALARGARAAGTRIRTGAEVSGILERGGRVTGVRLAGEETIGAGAVVVAAGAWAAGIGATCGAALPIEPRRRHLAMLAVDEEVPAASPVVWRIDEEVYFRPEPGGILASPCDEEPWPPGVPPSSPEALVRLTGRLSRLAPGLANGRVRRAWACLRSFAPDRGLVAGEDPRRRGLFWVGALGGRGMTCGLALGEVVAARVCGRPHPLAAALSPARLLGPRDARPRDLHHSGITPARRTRGTDTG